MIWKTGEERVKGHLPVGKGSSLFQTLFLQQSTDLSSSLVYPSLFLSKWNLRYGTDSSELKLSSRKRMLAGTRGKGSRQLRFRS